MLNALELNGRIEACGDTSEIVRVTGNHQVSARERSDDNRGVDDVASAGPRACDTGSSRAELVEVLYAATPQQSGQLGLRSTAPGLGEHDGRNDRALATQ